MVGVKGAKTLHKTRTVKGNSGVVDFSAERETFKTKCAADTQFQLVVQDHGTFKSQDLGDGIFFVSDQGMVIRSSFSPNTAGVYAESLKPSTSGRDSPDSKREGRKSLFGRRDVSARHEAQSEK